MDFDGDDGVDFYQSRSNSSTMIFVDYESKWKVIRLVFISALIIFTVLGNGMTLYAVCKMKSFRNSISNLYIASLAGADLIVGSFVMTFMMLYTSAFDEKWTFGEVFCDVWQTVDYASCTVSLYSVCAIGFDRWLNLEKPLRMFKRSKFLAKRAIFGIWILPFVVWIPIVVTMRLVNGPTSEFRCDILWRPKFAAPLVAALIFYVPVLVLTVLFVRISFVIRAHLQFLHNHSNRSLLDLSFCRHPDKSERMNRSMSLTPSPCTTRCKLNSFGAGTNGTAVIQSQKQLYKPTNLNLDRAPLSAIPQDHSSKATTHNTNNAEAPPTFSVGRSRSGTLPPFNGNQSPLAIQILKDRLSPSSATDQKSILPVILNGCLERKTSFRRNSESMKFNKSHALNKENTPLLDPNRLTAKNQTKSASRDSVCGDQKLSESRLTVEPANRRSSITSDTAFVFTKRVLTQKPPLLRARTDVDLEIQHAAAERQRSTRFSIISITGPLFNRRYSVNIFSDMLPCPSTAQQIRAAKAVGVLMLFFLICWLPFLILWPLKTYCDQCVPDTTYKVSIWANYLNSTVNPVLYTLCSPRFQRVFRENCRCALRWRSMKKRSK